jgi:hypothetical protein
VGDITSDTAKAAATAAAAAAAADAAALNLLQDSRGSLSPTLMSHSPVAWQLLGTPLTIAPAAAVAPQNQWRGTPSQRGHNSTSWNAESAS